MTNLEAVPSEVVCAGETTAAQVLAPRDVPLGGLRAMTVRRTLPQRDRSLIGAWCFADHYGPDDVAVTGGMAVAPHPHTGLQTVSWLFSGEIEHRDSLGSHAVVRPGELNLMTAGRGIAHSEVSTPATTVLHGVQLWTALPAAAVDAPPAFEHHIPPVVELPAPGDGVARDGGAGAATPARLRVFLGSLAGSTSPVRTFSPLLGAELVLPPDGQVELELDPAFEHGYLVDQGPVAVDGTTVAPGELAYLPPGGTRVHLAAPEGGPARLLVLGGAPLGEQVVMWWNFLGRSHDDVVAARAAWQAEVTGSLGRHAAARFGPVPGDVVDPLPAPELPRVKLLPRG
ncbi:pirin family protein [Actinotalea sp.]|uniref:pirin family protein n=1 Tax=Actinotalea sp. TaxID=1872145 RepID=UPI002BCBEB20|nr:pirin family protein [Actinotalea sp.]HQY32480.1 pirin family protein [Actinotalea sp.]HRA50073.1 pirin family protein [Actinotalea sp.]